MSRRACLLAAVVILIIEVLIALFVRDAFVRPYVGDVLAVMLVYCGLRAVFPVGSWMALGLSLGIAFAIEVGQLFNFVDRLGLGGSQVARVVLGTGFEPMDFVAYAAGGAIAVVADLLLKARAVRP